MRGRRPVGSFVRRSWAAGAGRSATGCEALRASPGFTLLEVVLALVVLQVGVLGVAGTLLLASRTLRRAETLERAVARTEGVLDSLRRGAAPGAGSSPWGGGEVRWQVDDSGRFVARATDAAGSLVLEVRSRVPVR